LLFIAIRISKNVNRSGRNYIDSHYTEHVKIKVVGYDHVVEKGSSARVGNIANLCDHAEDENTDMCI